jgi:hypothetical protein
MIVPPVITKRAKNRKTSAQYLGLGADLNPDPIEHG